jgi:RNA polymerase-associated protein RTF1
MASRAGILQRTHFHSLAAVRFGMMLVDFRTGPAKKRDAACQSWSIWMVRRQFSDPGATNFLNGFPPEWFSYLESSPIYLQSAHNLNCFSAICSPQTPINAAAEKARVEKELQAAMDQGRLDDIPEIKARIAELDAYIKKREGGDRLHAMLQLNKRNLQKNFKQDGLKASTDASTGGEYDPFSRRWTRSQNYWQTRATEEIEEVPAIDMGEVAAALPQPGEPGVLSLTDGSALAVTKAQAVQAANGDLLLPTEAPVDPKANALRVHSFDLPIDLEGLAKWQTAGGAAAAVLARKQRIETIYGAPIGVQKDSRRSLKITDYKRRRGLT